MNQKTSSTERVKQALQGLEVPYQLQELPHSTRTAVEAAQAVGASVSQIVKSLVFTSSAGKPLLILTSGSNQVDVDHVSQILGETITLSDPDFVRQQTGFAIGGVAPFGLLNEVPIYIDRDLLDYQLIWAAAGSPHAVFSMRPQDLLMASAGRLLDVHP